MNKYFCWTLSTILLAGLMQISVQAQSAVQIPASSVVEVTLTKPVDAKKSKVGDEVTAKVTRDLRVGDKVVISKNSKLIGHLTDVKAKSKEQPQSAVTISFEHAVLKEGGDIPITAMFQALAKPPDDRGGDMGDLMRGTGANQSVGGMASQVGAAGGKVGGSAVTLTSQSQGVLGYDGLGLQNSTVYSPVQNVHLDGGTQMILQVSGK